ncbi:MAG: FHA domain-containing protein [Nocardioides sp.]|nr:FHA domain-containing protein [Nocardioides sp.]
MRCPAGHESSATDYCDVCGVAMPAAGSPADIAPLDPPPTSPGTTAAIANDCPHCQSANLPDALFCEACGYDFTTGTLPRPLDPPVGVDPAPAASGVPASGVPRATPLPETANPSPDLDGWVAEVWIDPEWYADQESTDPLPSPGVPLVVALRNTSTLVGRVSRSRNINPDIDLSSDTGISRRHAQLTTDGSRWWVEDLGSSNGTYVGPTTGPLPKVPVPPGEKQEIGLDDRVYLGAWTRIILRKASPGEI